jgi:hypothetical protein
VPQRPLNPRGGTAARIEARLPDEDHDALTEQARRRGVRQPQLLREIIRHAVQKWMAEAELERAGPPAGG